MAKKLSVLIYNPEKIQLGKNSKIVHMRILLTGRAGHFAGVPADRLLRDGHGLLSSAI
jgi:hypothetical protein